MPNDNILFSLITKNGANLLKTGGILLLSNITNSALKTQTTITLRTILSDVRQVREKMEENKLQRA